MASVPALKEIEVNANNARLDNLEFHYFDGLDHSLNIADCFVTGKLPAGHEAIFDIDRVARKE